VNFFQKIIQHIEEFFGSGKAQKALETVASLVPVALPIVQGIALLTPNKTVQEVEAAYTKYAVPVAAQINNDPTSVGNALLNLATTVLAKNLPPGQATAATSILNTAVQIAVVGAKG
jgi:hypothetical protein